MGLSNSLKTVMRDAEYKFKEKGSQFLAFVHPCETEKDASEFLDELKKKYYDATHHCYDYEIFPDFFKYSDDGEPTGTAGIRIQNAINHFELTNLIVVVVRYFGGTKLGVGPLGKAYYNAAFNALEQAEIITKTNFTRAQLIYDYDFSKTAHHFLSKFEAIIENNNFEQRPSIIFYIKPDMLQSFEKEIKNSSGGKAIVKVLANNIFKEYNLG